ncbi:phenylalanine--tRNA ligase beta subunit, cytoplasmic-like [Ananas comosus]|uniref:Phenylalanine--tRNA ligase beta subunit, cytoplasmic-like n=1 Tax=Ananas comosus TaxID=4615 RepID=A0A6P5G726_ANACO|nr:phenylalanine--tRNA ligase beta subunit, cytoplasmic-like [Ananas comosus]XP_020104412.1 phenylalanine--tRNA ligase beta subunit, cytoplasmic-like [Ananas comosus]
MPPTEINFVPLKQVARAGYLEVLTWILCSHEENFSTLKREDDGKKAVIIVNPRSSKFEVVRTSLTSCLLKTLKHNIDHPRAIKVLCADPMWLIILLFCAVSSVYLKLVTW